MFLAIAVVMAIVLVWACTSRAFGRWSITEPVAMIVAGAAVGLTDDQWIFPAIDTEVALRLVEFLLALFLFSDATEIRDRIAKNTGVTRLLVAFMISLAIATVVGRYVLQLDSWPLLLVLACIVMPTDLVPAQSILRDNRITKRVRDSLNVESGLNDGLVAPVMLFALEAYRRSLDSEDAVGALGHAVTAVVKSVLTGVPLGAIAGVALSAAAARGWTDPRTVRCGILAIPVLSFAVGVLIDGNGFVAAFLAGIMYRATHRDIPGEPLDLTEGLAQFLGLGLWFVVGAIAVAIPRLEWTVIVYGLLALTAFRIVPVAVTLVGSRFTPAERVMLCCLGPRGVASIVFGLLAINSLAGTPDADLVVGATLVVVCGSIVVHGVGAPLIAAGFGRRSRRVRDVPGPSRHR
ncbi:sodium/hydrogen exchanger [Nocardia neocaledoniensis NBRC 108232]|uniref:Sodium/proton antiporter (CPA1 family) n=2 Tax=Nocardia neocaledoniensis TaxID=236511 RepID=A0A317NGP2_9NOCA|nr:cation:proton antiporter [Nocardia neocaledoniensis]PWV74335.1 sodium/proton antiporter (CPA1 family) [Nocardia neocaledoniensis]GEM32921.1 sodium/hydrogen exchanger [Nocardia neocaledoniensis NBRC 108232]